MNCTIYCDRDDGRGLVNDGCWNGDECVGLLKWKAVKMAKTLAQFYPACDWYVVRGVGNPDGRVELMIEATEDADDAH